MTRLKDDIKTLALQMLNKQGVDGVVTRDIAKKLKISLGNLTYHFPTKNDIIFALCEDLISAVDDALNQLTAKQKENNPLVSFYQQCELIGTIQFQYRFIFEKRYAEIITSQPKMQRYYQTVLKGRFDFYHKLHETLVDEKLAVPQLLKETDAFGYLINILGLFWHQETLIYFPTLTDRERLKHSLTVFFQIYKPYLTTKGTNALRPYLTRLKHY